MERDIPDDFLRNVEVDFNSHAHVERDYCGIVYPPHTLHFNSHAHVERDGIEIPKVEEEPISTHTLTWSVTLTGAR